MSGSGRPDGRSTWGTRQWGDHVSDRGATPHWENAVTFGMRPEGFAPTPAGPSVCVSACRPYSDLGGPVLSALSADCQGNHGRMYDVHYGLSSTSVVVGQYICSAGASCTGQLACPANPSARRPIGSMNACSRASVVSRHRVLREVQTTANVATIMASGRTLGLEVVIVYVSVLSYLSSVDQLAGRSRGNLENSPQWCRDQDCVMRPSSRHYGRRSFSTLNPVPLPVSHNGRTTE